MKNFLNCFFSFSISIVLGELVLENGVLFLHNQKQTEQDTINYKLPSSTISNTEFDPNSDFKVVPTIKSTGVQGSEVSLKAIKLCSGTNPKNFTFNWMTVRTGFYRDLKNSESHFIQGIFTFNKLFQAGIQEIDSEEVTVNFEVLIDSQTSPFDENCVVIAQVQNAGNEHLFVTIKAMTEDYVTFLVSNPGKILNESNHFKLGYLIMTPGNYISSDQNHIITAAVESNKSVRLSFILYHKLGKVQVQLGTTVCDAPSIYGTSTTGDALYVQKLNPTDFEASVGNNCAAKETSPIIHMLTHHTKFACNYQSRKQFVIKNLLVDDFQLIPVETTVAEQTEVPAVKSSIGLVWVCLAAVLIIVFLALFMYFCCYRKKAPAVNLNSVQPWQTSNSPYANSPVYSSNGRQPVY